MMTRDKAREFFSSYYEATLEPGLRQAFENRLDGDSDLQADYAAFVETMEELETLSLEEIPVPSFLNDRIAARIATERAKRKPVLVGWNTWLRGLGFAGLATAAIAGAFFSFGHRNGGASTADLTGQSQNVDQLTFSGHESTLKLDYRSSSNQTVIVTSVMTGQEVDRISVDGSASRTITNPNPDTALFRIQVQGQPTSTLVAVPGSRVTTETSGEGTLTDFVGAVARRYHTPVILRNGDPKEHMTWKLDGTSAQQAAESALDGHGLTVDERGDILNIAQN